MKLELDDNLFIFFRKSNDRITKYRINLRHIHSIYSNCKTDFTLLIRITV
jgi:hypothetical protein